jgi:hypothetical protein
MQWHFSGSDGCFWHARQYWSFLPVLVAALAFEARDFAAFTRNGTPFVPRAMGTFGVNFP